MDALQMVRLALSIITERLLTILSLIGVFVVIIITVMNPDLIRLGTAIVFAVFAYALVKNKEQNNGKDEL
jgi:hypothetical protein